MKLSLVRGTLLRRYKRFLADINVDGQTVIAHVPNTGSMATLIYPGVDAWLTAASNPDRKLKYTLSLLGLLNQASPMSPMRLMSQPGGDLAMVDTQLPNHVVSEGIRDGAIPELAGYARLRREVVYGSRGSRIDIVLEDDTKPPCYVEVKNTTMLSATRAGRCDFPDAISERGRKHLYELADCVRNGGRAVQFYLVDRTDCTSAGIASTIDASYAMALREAIAAGVEVICYRAHISTSAITVGTRCPFDFT